VRAERVRRTALAVPAVLLLGLAAILALSHGGYSSTTWYPAALFVLALLAVLLGSGVAGPQAWSGPAGIALAAYAGYVVWCYLTIIWADVPALAWDGANRSLLYGLVLAIISLRRWSTRDLRLGLGALSGTIALIAIGVLIATAGTHPENLYLEGRLADPLGYANATPNLFLIGLFPALALALDRALPWQLRGLFVGIAGLLAQMSLLSQSRGAIVAFFLVSIVFVAVSARRWAALVAIFAVFLTTVATSAPVLDVHDAALAEEIGELLYDARLAILLGTAVLLWLGLAACWLDQDWSPLRRMGHNTPRGNRAMAMLAGGLVVIDLISMGNPATWVGDRWDDFKNSGYEKVDAPGNTRLTSGLGSQRYDFYRVALNEFADHPLGGIGVDSFGPSYLLHGETDQNPRYTHSLALAVLAETGLIGLLLFGTFTVAIIVAMVRASRAGPGSRGLVVGAACGAAMFFTGAMFDWLWQFPALGVLGFALLGMASNHESAPEPEPEEVLGGHAPEDLTEPEVVAPAHARPLEGSAWRLGPIVPRLIGGLIVLAAGLSLIAPGVAARFVDAAYEDAATDVARAIQRLDRAADLNPLSPAPLLTKNVLLRRQGRIDEAMAVLVEAAKREPDNWFIPFERALLAAQEKRWDEAIADLRRAKALNPRQVVIDEVLASTRRKLVFPADKAEAQLADQTSRRLKPTE
jgi:hypothetical protein